MYSVSLCSTTPFNFTRLIGTSLYTFQLVCRDISCQENDVLQRIAPRDPECLTIRRDTCYLIYVKLTLQEGSNLTDALLQDRIIILKLIRYLERIITGLNEILEDLEVYKKSVQSDDAIIVKYLVLKMKISCPDFYWEDVLKDLLMHLHNNDIFLDQTETIHYHFVSELVAYSPSNHQDNTLYVANRHNTTVDVLSREYQITYATKCNETVLFTKIQFCPFIEIGVNELSTKYDNDFLVIEDTLPQKILSRWEYERHIDKIRVCLEDFQIIYNQLPWTEATNNTNKIISATRVFSFICVCLSIACLLVTISVYLSIPSLQTQPGVNNVVLCVSLLLAQAFYQFGAGQRSISPLACTFIGAVCHFCWLCVLFCMNICSIKMFTTFKNNIKLSPKFKWKTTFGGVLYVTFSSLILVCINLIVSIIRSNGQESGYGGSVCYLSSALMHIITFIIPTAAVVAVNIILFAHVVFTIDKTKRLGLMQNQHRTYLTIYARLSTLVGITWVFGYMYIVLENEIFEYLFIIFNACQGVFIMIAFILNRRVCILFYRRITIRNRATLTTRTEGTEIPVTEEKNDSCLTTTLENKISYLANKGIGPARQETTQ